MRYLFRCKVCGHLYERKYADDTTPCDCGCNNPNTPVLPGKTIKGYVELIGEVYLK